MEWNGVTDKFILEWLCNRTPPSCVCVNMLSMTVAIYPNTKVVKEILCTKYIRNMRSVLSLLTKCLAGKVIGSSTKIKQMHTHTDGTSHKGTEIVNLICGILTKDSKLRAICVAGDIIAEDGTAECQSTVIVNQFSESGQLLDGWREHTKAMYANNPELLSLLAEIPKKESLCVLQTLGATFFGDNCSTQRLNQSRISAKIIELSRQSGITNKKLPMHNQKHCFNHQRNTISNAIAIGIGTRIGDALMFGRKSDR